MVFCFNTITLLASCRINDAWQELQRQLSYVYNIDFLDQTTGYFSRVHTYILLLFQLNGVSIFSDVERLYDNNHCNLLIGSEQSS